MHKRQQASMFYHKGIFNFLIHMKVYMYICNTLAYKLKQTFHLFTKNIKVITRVSFITDQNFLFNQIFKA